jgi:hypothetical protein
MTTDPFDSADHLPCMLVEQRRVAAKHGVGCDGCGRMLETGEKYAVIRFPDLGAHGSMVLAWVCQPCVVQINRVTMRTDL